MASSACSSSISLAETLVAHDKLVEKLAKDVLWKESEVNSSDACSVASSLEKDEKADTVVGLEDVTLPKKDDSRPVRFFRHQVFTLYRKLFGVVLVTNLALFIWFVVRGANAKEVAGAIIANLFVSIIHRQEYLINAYFWLFTRIPLSAPFWLRSVAARVYHIGGLHSGCGVSGTIWFILFTGQATKEFVRHQGTISIPTLAISYCIMFLLVGILVFAYPELRLRHHNNFEMTHRFMGWTAVGLVWGLLVLLTNDYKPAEISLGNALIHSPYIWLISIFTVSIALPWMRLRKYKVHSEVLSNHCVRLYFDYTTPPPGSFTRVSTSPLTEWHSFATITVPDKKGYSMIISRAGDWTSKRIDDPPTEIWVRGIPTQGMLSAACLFRKILFVATGSGVAPICPWLFSIKMPFRLLWVSPNVRQTFGNKLVNDIFKASPDSIVYDTRIHGRPDMVKLVYLVAKEYQPEAVCVISNEATTKKVVYGMVSRGIPAFGPIWDS